MRHLCIYRKDSCTIKCLYALNSCFWRLFHWFSTNFGICLCTNLANFQSVDGSARWLTSFNFNHTPHAGTLGHYNEVTCFSCHKLHARIKIFLCPCGFIIAPDVAIKLDPIVCSGNSLQKALLHRKPRHHASICLSIDSGIGSWSIMQQPPGIYSCNL